MIDLYDTVEVRGGGVVVRFTSDFKKTKIAVDDFWANYSDTDLSDMDESLLTIPMILNVAPAIWAMNLNVKVPVIDKSLSSSLERLKLTFKSMYPELNWAGNLHAENLADNYYVTNERPALFFSGGLDSVFSAIRNINEKPLLVSVRGSDISLSDKIGWELVKSQSNRFGETYGLDVSFIESNFYDFLNQPFLTLSDFGIPSWWAGVQHGMGLAGLIAPLAVSHEIPYAYIASTHSKEFSAPWGSNPEIDNNIFFGETRFVHDGYDFTRHEKVKELLKISKFANLEKPLLRVCYSNRKNSGENCCKCEKCSRTITALLVEGENPKNYGFNVSLEKFASDVKSLFDEDKVITNESSLFMWQDILKDLKDFTFYEFAGLPEFAVEYLKWIASVNLIGCKKSFDDKLKRRKKIIKTLKIVPFLFPFARALKNRFGRG